ncbi:hypothetical protein BN14_10238 [Rhizoctonia solani AG-1 IB]|uniref:Uncharacterized protein n=1 Tax=Thanatephorus cucumeris (strain AG1-IB / isolate 7/3/14) TaxID=1108050 RepID=M5C9Z6_THACB|nr:hypothetical protein BN14_10238 [Rhizoctonia solani AG-1 IB]
MLLKGKAFGVKEPQLHTLAHITKAKGGKGDVRTGLVLFTQFGWLIILDVTSVTNVVGRVQTESVKLSGKWYIINQCSKLTEIAFNPPEHKYEYN